MNKQSGFSIVELMVASTIALIIIAAIMTIYVSTIKNSRNLLSSASLSQELTAVMNILVTDIRRGGFMSSSSANPEPNTNPFLLVEKRLPETEPAQYFMPYAININADQDCISLAYDADQDTVNEVQKNDVFAFRLKNQTIQTLQYPKLNNFAKNGCANDAGSWMTITDKDLILITKLKFSTLGSQCYDMHNEIQWKVTEDTHLFPCLSVKGLFLKKNPFAEGNRLVGTHVVTVRIEAHLSSDKRVKKVLNQQVKIRNDAIITIPKQDVP